MEPGLHEAAQHRTVALFGVAFAYRVEAVSTDGRLAVLEVTIPPRTLVKPHQHSKEDELSLILSGQVGARIGERTYEEIGPGSSAVKPRDVPHAMWNVADEPARILEIVLPAGIETYFEKLAPILDDHGPDADESYRRLAEEYGLTILDDWTAELEARYGITL